MDTFTDLVNLCKERLELVNYVVKPDTTFEEMGLDSLDLAELIMDIEEEYELEISDEDLAKFKTLQDVAGYIDER